MGQAVVRCDEWPLHAWFWAIVTIQGKKMTLQKVKSRLWHYVLFSLFVLLWHDLKDGQFGAGWWCQTIWRIFFLSSSELLKYIFGAKHSRGSSVCEICPRLDKDKFWPHKRISVAAQLVSSGQSLGFYAMNTLAKLSEKHLNFSVQYMYQDSRLFCYVVIHLFPSWLVWGRN